MKAKIIDLFTGKEIIGIPYNGKTAKDVMDYLMKYQNPRTGASVTDDEFKIIDTLLKMIENSSGIAREEALEQGA